MLEHRQRRHDERLEQRVGARRRARARRGSPRADATATWRGHATGHRRGRTQRVRRRRATATDSIRISSTGRSAPSVAALPISSTTSMPERDPPEDGVQAVEPRAASAVTMKNCEPFVFGPEFAIAITPRVDPVVVRLVLELVAGAAHAGAGRVAALDHEVRDHAVEDHAVVEAVLRQLDEVRDRLRGVGVEELELENALVRGDDSGAHGAILPTGTPPHARTLRSLYRVGWKRPMGSQVGVTVASPAMTWPKTGRGARLDRRCRCGLRVPRRPSRLQPRRVGARQLRGTLGLRRPRADRGGRLPHAGGDEPQRAVDLGHSRARDPLVLARGHLLRLRLRRQPAVPVDLRRLLSRVLPGLLRRARAARSLADLALRPQRLARRARSRPSPRRR